MQILFSNTKQNNNKTNNKTKAKQTTNKTKAKELYKTNKKSLKSKVIKYKAAEQQ